MITKHRNHAGLTIIGFITISLCVGCAGVAQKLDDWQSNIRESLNASHLKNASAGAENGDSEYFIHKSRWSWETLAHVAEWYTGDPQNAEELAQLNPQVNTENIAVGSDIAIPRNMLLTREPLPRNYSRGDPKNYYTHKVRWPGESLSLISSWYTGSSKNWRKLARLNPRLDPNRIKGGDVVRIPSGLLKTHVSLPQKVAAKYTSDYFAYKVKKDDEKLEDIAKWYTGNAANRSQLAKVNPDLNPDHLKKGNEVYIPKKLLITSQPYKKPTTAASPSKPVDKSLASQKKAVQVMDEKVELFGPKQFPEQ